MPLDDQGAEMAIFCYPYVKIGKNSRIFSLSDPIIPFNGMAIGQSGSNQVA